MAYKGKTHLTFIFKASQADVAEGDRLFASHNRWMAKTHHREGPKALLTYNVSKGADPATPSTRVPLRAGRPSTCWTKSTESGRYRGSLAAGHVRLGRFPGVHGVGTEVRDAGPTLRKRCDMKESSQLPATVEPLF